jgi:acyl-coenzyme A synthetase/AMP-(fatty) acid ligase
MPPSDRRSLFDLIAASGLPSDRFMADAEGRMALRVLDSGSSLGVPAETLRGQSVLLSSERQRPAVLAMAELDGIARRLVLAPPDLSPEHLPAVIADAEIDAILTDGTGPARAPVGDTRAIPFGLPVRPAARPAARDQDTEWLLFTSGTTGRPKMVVHTLQSLIGPLTDGLGLAPDAVWSTFYDVRRYGGLTILMRAFLGGSAMVLSQAGEPVAEFLARAGECGVTHMSGTPSHWRRALMTPAIAAMAPRYVRLSGEVADQAILNSLALAFPQAGVAHAFASTEAGVAFDVRDGLAGFPPAALDHPAPGVTLKIEDGTLRIRSSRTGSCYAGHPPRPLADADGFVDTGDLIIERDGRFHFGGRREGVINVGGQKVHPEEVEAVINQHPAVRMSRVRARRSPITGALVVADIVPAEPGAVPFETLREEILARCRAALPAHKVPAMLTEAASLDITAAGKLARRVA